VVVEICSTSLKSIKNAALAGADRVELCSGLELGGITPSVGLIEEAVSLKLIDIHCLIRPRAGHFTYSEDEKKIIEKDIRFALEAGCRGVVVGGLTSNFKLDIPTLKYWKQISGDMYLTFHRAFDVVINPIESIKQLIDLGFDCILSSGQQEKAVDGLDKLNLWNKQFGKDILIMPGSGINKSNCKLFQSSGFNAIHLSGWKAESQLEIPTGVNAEISFLNQQLGESDLKTIGEVVSELNTN
jgi:copper homeostasis protein